MGRIKAARCIGCGKRILDEDVTMRIEHGHLYEQDHFVQDHGGLWGYMHKKCFLLAIRDPEAIDFI